MRCGVEPLASPLKLSPYASPVHVCLISTEFFDRGVFGGFGRAVRMIGRELVRRGVRVTAVAPARGGAPRDVDVDGIRVLEFNRRSVRDAFQLLRSANADVYHSQDPSLWTYVAQRAAPERRHVVTFRDPRTLRDWKTEWVAAGHRSPAWLAYPFLVDNALTTRAVRRADRRFVAAPELAAKVTSKYGLAEEPVFLPTPVAIPAAEPKSVTPLVCWIGRLDRRKRPELFLELARRVPEVEFVAVGGVANARRDAAGRRAARSIANLDLRDRVDQFASDELFRLLARSWVITNTSVLEALPTTFVEAAATGCAVLALQDTTGFAARFGYAARDLDDLERGLRHLLDDDRWRLLGAAGHAFVSTTYETSIAIEAHLHLYRELVDGASRAAAA
jgi:glycosyltransferase involved in cell wall biosynthesis